MEVSHPVTQHAAHRPQALVTNFAASDCVYGDILSPHGSHIAYGDRAEGQPQNPRQMLTRDHDFRDTVPQKSPDFDDTHIPYLTTAGSRQFVEYIGLEVPIAVRETEPSRKAGPSISGPASREETMRLSLRSQKLKTNNTESRNPNKRKRAVSHKEPSEDDRTRLQKRQRHLNLPPSFLPGRPELRRVQQDVYVSKNPQKEWIRLPDIDFRVGGIDGIRLTDAKDTRFDGPDDRDDLVFTSGDVGHSVSCRIAVGALHDIGFQYD